MALERAGDAREGTADATKGDAERVHQPFFVHQLHQPLCQAALADAGLADQREEPALAVGQRRGGLGQERLLAFTPKERRQLQGQQR